MAGRSTKGKHKKLEAEDDSDSSIPEPAPKRARKRRKASPALEISNQPSLKRARAGKGRGLLEHVELPIDVLLEIFGHLEPSDLLHLARTTKFLRSILMSRSSISTWKKSIQNVGLPPCPSDINEPQYADLVFGKICDLCWRKLACLYPIWTSRVKSCKRCIETRFTAVGTYAWSKFKSNRGYPHELAEHLPVIQLRGQRYVDREIDEEWLADYQANQTNKDKEAWLLRMLSERIEISDHAKKCETWEKEQEGLRLQQSKLLVKEREALILERLKGMGWAEELEKLSPDQKGPMGLYEVTKACQKELTEKVLAYLDERLNECMENIKEARLKSERKAFFGSVLRTLQGTYTEYVKTQPAHLFFPNTADIFFHPFVHKNLSGVLSSEGLDEALEVIKPKFPKIVEECIGAIQQELSNLILQAHVAHNHSFDLTKFKNLATTLFTCDCLAYLTFDQAVAHYCIRVNSYWYRVNDQETMAVADAIRAFPWKLHQNIKFNPSVLSPIVQIFQTCGFDPTLTTIAEMNEADPIFECLSCSSDSVGRTTMRWFNLGPHLAAHYHRSSAMVLLPEHEAQIARERILEEEQKQNAQIDTSCICVHCREKGASMSLLRHVKQEHQVANPVYGKDVILCPGTLPYSKAFCLWPPKLD